MGISPPTQYAPTEVTDSASRVAAPASAAFPPCSRILMPAAVAAGRPETTTPWLPAATLGPRRPTGVLAACGQAKVASKSRQTDDIEMILRIRGRLRRQTRVTSKLMWGQAALGCPAARKYRAAAAPHYIPVILSEAKGDPTRQKWRLAHSCFLLTHHEGGCPGFEVPARTGQSRPLPFYRSES